MLARLDDVRELVVGRVVGAVHLAVARGDVADERGPVRVELPRVGLLVGRDDAVRAVRDGGSVLIDQIDPDPDEVRLGGLGGLRAEGVLDGLLGGDCDDAPLLAVHEELVEACRGGELALDDLGRRAR